MFKKLFFPIFILFFVSGTLSAFAAIDPIYEAINTCKADGGTVYGWNIDVQEWLVVSGRNVRNYCGFSDGSVCEIFDYNEGSCDEGEYQSFEIYSEAQKKPNLVIEQGGLGYAGYLTEVPIDEGVSLMEIPEGEASGPALFDNLYGFDLHTADWVSSEVADYYLMGLKVCNYGTLPSNDGILNYNEGEIYDVPSLGRDECANVVVLGALPVGSIPEFHKFILETPEDELSQKDNEYSFFVSKEKGFEGINGGYLSSDYYKWKGFYRNMDNEIIDEDLLTPIGGVKLIFNDVDSNYFYADAIEFLKNNGIINGYDDGSFKPENKINRAELLRIVMEARYSNEEIENALVTYKALGYEYVDYTDVGINEWYAPYIRLAVKNEIIDGYADGTYKPDRDINFVEALKIVLEAYDIDYEEDEEIWYRGIVEQGSAMNIIPLSIDSFDYEITRALMSDMITRMIKFLDTSLNDYLGSLKSIRQTYDNIEEGKSVILSI